MSRRLHNHPIPRPTPHPNFTLAPSPTRSPSQTIAGVTPSRGVLHSMNTPRPPPHFIKRAAPDRGVHPQPCPRPAPHRPATAGGGVGIVENAYLRSLRLLGLFTARLIASSSAPLAMPGLPFVRGYTLPPLWVARAHRLATRPRDDRIG